MAVVGAAAIGVIGAACMGFKAIDVVCNGANRKDRKRKRIANGLTNANEEHDEDDANSKQIVLT